MGGSIDKIANVATFGLSDAVGLTNSNEMADAASSAASAQTSAASQNVAYQKWLFGEQKELQAPWRNAGIEALKRIEDAPDFEFTAEDFLNFQDPSYQFRMDEGINALDRSAASRGRLLSGGQDRAITRYGSELASTEYGNAFNRAKTKYDTNLNTDKSLAGVGQQATGATANAMNTMGQNVSQSTTDIGNALAQQSIQTAKSNIDSGNALLGAGATGLGIAFSDERLKENIEYLFSIRDIDFFKWDWNKTAKILGIDSKCFGCIAQKLLDNHSDFVSENQENGYMQINYSKVFEYTNIEIKA